MSVGGVSYRGAVSEWTCTAVTIQTERVDLCHISAMDLITLYEEPEDTGIYFGKGYTNPLRVLMDEPGPLRWRVPQVFMGFQTQQGWLRSVWVFPNHFKIRGLQKRLCGECGYGSAN